MEIQNILSYLGSGFSLIGIYMIIISYQKSNEKKHTLAKGKVAEGTVIELRENPGDLSGNDKGNGFAPVVEFRTDHGLYKHYSTTYRFPSPYSLGQKVKIYYYIYKSRYEFALQDDEPGSLPGTMMKWGIAFCILGLPLLFLKMSKLF